MEIFFAIYAILSLENTHVKNFLIKSNHGGEIVYKSVEAKKCISGPRDDTYVIAPTGKVMFKQVSLDGSVGEVCK